MRRPVRAYSTACTPNSAARTLQAMICHHGDGQVENKPASAIPPLNKHIDRLSGASSIGVLSMCDQVQRRTPRIQFM